MIKLAIISFVILTAVSFLIHDNTCDDFQPQPSVSSRPRPIYEVSCSESRGFPYLYYETWHGFAPAGSQINTAGGLINLILLVAVSLEIGYIINFSTKRLNITSID